MDDSSLFPVTVVGSWPRPPWLIQALRKRQAGESSFKEFNAVADDAVLASVKQQEDAGVDIVSDGEQRRDNFYSFVVEKLDGIKLMTVAQLLDFVKDRASFEESLRALDVPAFAMKSPVAVGQVHARDSLALDELKFLKEHTDRNASRRGRARAPSSPRRDDRARGRECDPGLWRAGRASGAPCHENDPNRGGRRRSVVWLRASAETARARALELMNRTVQGISGIKLGVHVCRGNWSRREDVLLKGNYGPLLPYLTEMKVDQLVLEFATPRAGELEVFKEYGDEKEIGLGVVNPRSSEVESSDLIEKRVRDATKFFDPSKIYLNPDCGFGTFAERPVNDATTACAKLQSISTAAKRLRQGIAIVA